MGNSKTNRTINLWVLCTVTFLLLLPSCTFYKSGIVRTDTKNTTEDVLTEYCGEKNFYTVLHYGSNKTELQELNYLSAFDSISALSLPIDSNSLYTKYFDKIGNRRTTKRIKMSERQYANQIHLYVKTLDIDGPYVGFKEADIKQIDIYKRNRAAEISANGLLSAIGAFGSGFLLLIYSYSI